MRRRSSVFLLSVAVAVSGCASDRTTVTVLVTSSAVVSLRSVEVTAHAVGPDGLDATQVGPLGGSSGLRLPGRIVIEVPPEAQSLSVTVDGIDQQSATLSAHGEVTVVAHHDVTLPMTLSASAPPDDGPDLGGAGDASGVSPDDAGGPADAAAPPGNDGALPSDGGAPPDLAGCGGPCSGGKICCGHSCVDPSSDPGNCGGCGVVCASGKCGTTVSASMSTLPSDWTFNTAAGAASGSFFDNSKGVAVVTADSVNAVGSIMFQHPIAVDGFDARFDVRVTHVASQYGDGMGFMMIKQNSAVARIDTAVGITGGGLGVMAPTANGSSTVLTGFAVELDSFDNDSGNSCGETLAGDHVNIDTLAQCFISSGSVPTPVATAQATTLGDGNWHTVRVQLSAGRMTVTITQGNTTRTLFNGVALPNFKSGDSYFFGFGGACGGLSERQELRNVSITFPTTRCL
jgi:hypothetical protein